MPKTSYICNCDVIHEDIVNDVKSKMQPKDDYIQLASLFKLFGDGTRVQILHALEQSEMCVCDLAVLLGVTKSAISHQLKALRLANLVKFRKEAQIVYYSLADDHVKEIIDKGFGNKSFPPIFHVLISQFFPADFTQLTAKSLSVYVSIFYFLKNPLLVVFP